MKRGRKMKLPTGILPQEMCNEIFSRLSVKPLLKFRSVSKLWCSLIDSPHFASTHLIDCQKNQERSRLLVIESPDVVDGEQECTVRSADKFRKIFGYGLDVTWFEQYQVIGYINGIVCMKKNMEETQFCELFLWNPSIKKLLELPLPHVRNSVSMKLDVDFAFGFDSITNDYKVIATMFTSVGTSIPQSVDIYTLKKGYWRSISIEKAPCLWSKDDRKVFLNGVTYWVGIDFDMASTLEGKYTHFVAFDACNDTFNYIELPNSKDVNASMHQSFPVILGQSIVLMEIFQTHSCIWVMEEFGVTKTWTKKYLIDLQLCYNFLHLKPDGELLFSGESEGVNSYNIESQETTVLAKTYKLTPRFIDVYMESLVLINQVHGRPLRNFPVPKTSTSS